MNYNYRLLNSCEQMLDTDEVYIETASTVGWYPVKREYPKHEKYDFFRPVRRLVMQDSDQVMKLSYRLKSLRARKKLKLKELAALTGLSVSYLSDIERGRTNPSLETCGKLCRVYDLEFGQLFWNVTLDNPHETPT